MPAGFPTSVQFTAKHPLVHPILETFRLSLWLMHKDLKIEGNTPA